MDRMILGDGCAYGMDSSRTGLNNNVIVCGSSGCGKTMSIIEPRLLEANNSSLCVTVTKRRIVDKYKPLFRGRGYGVWDLDLAHPGNSSVGFDPLAYINSERDITMLAESIVKTDEEGHTQTPDDPFWQNAAASLLSAEIAYIWTTETNATFADVLDMQHRMRIFQNGDRIETTLDEEFGELEEAAPDEFAVTCWHTFRCLPMRTASCVYATLNSILDTMFSPELLEVMAKGQQVDFRKLASGKTVLFITTSPVDPSLQHFINLFYGTAFKELFEYAERRPDGVLPIPVQVLCDDFATGGEILNFAQYISIFREKGLSITMLIQSESQLAGMYGDRDATTIINNCDTYIYMGGMDLATADRISLRLNAPLEDVMYMPVGQEIVIRRGQKPVITKRYDVGADTVYRQITDFYEEGIRDTLLLNELGI